MSSLRWLRSCVLVPPSDHAGDWVFSVGGYHRSYTPPPWYPVPKRLGISFNVDIISITGEAYFAITPKCVMGGAMIHAALSIGPLSAWLDANFDALIQFHPLHYSVDFSVAIGIRLDVDFLFVHIHITAHIGAQLHIEGPEFGGSAHVDFWFMGFDFDFGATAREPPALDLLQFWEMLHQPGPASSQDPGKQHDAPIGSLLTYNFVSKDPNHNKSPSLVDGAALKLSLEDGNFPMPAQPDSAATGAATSTGAGSKWYVKGGSFQFRVSSDLALSEATLQKSEATFNADVATEAAAAKLANRPVNKVSLLRTETSPAKIYSKPMHVGEAQGTITSSLAVMVINTTTGEVIDNFRAITLVTKDVPTALWDPYDSATDPKQKPAALLNGDKPTVKQCMGVSFAPPLPYLSPPIQYDGMGLFIPKFKASAAAKFGILDFRTDKINGTDWILPASEPKQVKHLPREHTAEEDKKTNSVLWADMRTTWSGLASKDPLVNGANTGVLAAAAKMLAWDTHRPQTEELTLPKRKDGRRPWELLGGIPKKTVKNLEGFYLDLPRVTAVSA